MAGTAGVTILSGLIRTKFAAIFLGTLGVGLIASFTTIQTLMSSFAGFGLQGSAVRQIASADSNSDQITIIRIYISLKRICFFAGLLGAGCIVFLSPLISQITFGNHEYVSDIAFLGSVIFFINLSTPNIAVLQGKRLIGNIAKLNIVSSILGTIAAIILYSIMGFKGIIPSIIAIAIIHYVISEYFFSKIKMEKVKSIPTIRETYLDLKSMAHLGLAFTISGLVNAILSYGTVALIMRHEGPQQVGVYSAAFVLSGFLVNFVLSSMGTDYYPRLSSCIKDKITAVRIINEQTQIGIFLSLPGVLTTYLFANILIVIAYSPSFLGATFLVQVFLLGVFARVISWPLGYVVLARGEAFLFFTIELILTSIQLLIVHLFLEYFGLYIVAWAFVATSILNIVIEYKIASIRIGFKYSQKSMKVMIIAFFSLLFTIIVTYQLRDNISFYLLGFLIVFISIIYSVRNISANLDKSHFINRFIDRCNLLKILLHKS